MAWVVACGLLLCLGGIVACERTRGQSAGAKTSRPNPADLSPDELFAAFRAADGARDIDAFERWALEIDRRRLLEGLSREEIEARLGNEHGTRWVYLDQKAVEQRSLLTQWTLKKGDYWYYSARARRQRPYVRVVFGLAFDDEKLAWTYYERHNFTLGKSEKEVTTYYGFVPTSQQAGNANQGGAEP